MVEPTCAVDRRHTRCRTTRLIISATIVFIFASIGRADDWPYWRGPNRNDIVAEASGWSNGQWPIGGSLWNTNVGIGCTSPIIVNGHLYTMGWRSNKDYLYCFNAATGKEVWRQSYAAPKYGRQATGDQGIYAGICSTPEYDPKTGFLYTLSLDGHLNCWNTKSNGDKIWGFNLYDKYDVKRRPEVAVRKKTQRDYGYTTSPFVYNDWLIVEVGDDTGNLIAYDKNTGKQVWTSESKDEAGHSGGLVPMTVEGVPCVAVLTLRNLVVTRLDKGHEGKSVATYQWTTDFANNIPTPAVHDNFVIITSAYNHYAICKVKVTLRGATKVWEQGNPSGVCSPIIHKGHVYWAWRGVHCLDLATGDEKWKGGRAGSQGSCILTADQRLIVWTNRGDLQLVESAERSPNKFTTLAEKNGIFATDAWPHVVLSGGRLYCKDRNGNLTCFAVTKSAAALAAKPVPTVPTKPPSSRPVKTVNLKSWPGDDPGLVLAWQREFGPDRVAGSANGQDRKVRLEARGSATLTKTGMQLSKGAFVLRGADEALLNACRKTGELSIEAVLTSSKAKQSGPARIISFSSDGFNRNFSLAQEADQLLLRLRTPRTGKNGMNPQTTLGQLKPNERHHLIITYRDGQLVFYFDGRKVKESSAVQGDFTNWDDQHLLLGDEWDGGGTRDWSGQLERIALFSRYMGEEEATRRFSLSSLRKEN